MRNIKTKGRSRMGDEVLDCLMRIASKSRGQSMLSVAEFRSSYAFRTADYFWSLKHGRGKGGILGRVKELAAYFVDFENAEATM